MRIVRYGKGQSVLEYVVILSAIVLAVIVGIYMLGLTPTRTLDQTKGLGKMLYQVNRTLENKSSEFRNFTK